MGSETGCQHWQVESRQAVSLYEAVRAEGLVREKKTWVKGQLQQDGTVGLDAGKNLAEKEHTPRAELLIARVVKTFPEWWCMVID